MSDKIPNTINAPLLGETPNPMPMFLTNVQVYPVKKVMGKTHAFARVVLNDQIQFTGLRIVEGSNGLFVAYPTDPSYKGEDYKSIFYPVTREFRELIETEVIKKFQEMMMGESDFSVKVNIPNIDD